MVRWEPGTGARLREAALALFAANGFEQTTAAEIAGSIGLTERTFYRHFADKREVLFGGGPQYLQRFVDGIAGAPPDASPMELVAAGLQASAEHFTAELRPHSRARQAVIDANPPLRERERQKLAEVATAMAEALRERGILEPAATLAAETGAAVRRVSFLQWLEEGQARSLDELDIAAMAELRALTSLGE